MKDANNNEDSPTGFNPDGMDIETPSIDEALINISDAHSRAEKCGSASRFQCFMNNRYNEENKEKGRELCKDLN
ncbi:hypothetical protein ACN0IV_14230 [Trabulsiella odontotermitis]|uniref:hypothetical protein n=1 Tax=Trabulsiella odontotermitis TaxID=379893 RepID=UPI003ABF0028